MLKKSEWRMDFRRGTLQSAENADRIGRRANIGRSSNMLCFLFGRQGIRLLSIRRKHRMVRLNNRWYKSRGMVMNKKSDIIMSDIII